MSRTGSGKTAAFLIPTLHKLKEHSLRVGVRCVVISPTRELTMQSYQMCRQLGKFTNLKSTAITGGEGLNSEFEALSRNPDIIFATPGRLMHLISELDIGFSSVETLILDEADRLFEMGISEQLMLIFGKMTNPTRQTLLFSATMPGELANFATVGLNNPVIVKLDKDLKLPETLRMDFFLVRNDDKNAALLFLLRKLVGKLGIVFVSTKHHVEYLEYMM
jgi:ATP-dependent RNA helicase DDX54/DBP10